MLGLWHRPGVIFLGLVLVTLGNDGFFLCRDAPHTEKGADITQHQHLLGVPAVSPPCYSPSRKTGTHIPILEAQSSPG